MIPDKTTIVTAFYDIGRARWESKTFSRSNETYFAAFKNLLKYAFNTIIFVDCRHRLMTEDLVASSPFPHTKQVIAIDERWLDQNIWAWSRLEREREIMDSPQYKSLIPRRVAAGYPENIKPEYTILVHSKIDFVNYAISSGMSDAGYFIWVDFGYLLDRIMPAFAPHSKIDPTKFVKGKINLCSLGSPLNERDRDMLYTLRNAPAKLTGGVFGGDGNAMTRFQNLCHVWLEKFQHAGIADDEQALWIQCVFDRQSEFAIHAFPGWHHGLRHFTTD